MFDADHRLLIRQEGGGTQHLKMISLRWETTQTTSPTRWLLAGLLARRKWQGERVSSTTRIWLHRIDQRALGELSDSRNQPKLRHANRTQILPTLPVELRSPAPLSAANEGLNQRSRTLRTVFHHFSGFLCHTFNVNVQLCFHIPIAPFPLHIPYPV